MRISENTSSMPIQKLHANTSTSDVNSFPKKNDESKEMHGIEAGVQAKKEINEDELIQAIEHANKSVKTYDRKLEFSIHEKTKQIMVKVIDTSGDEEKVIREIPPEKVLDMVARLWEMAGILVDEKA